MLAAWFNDRASAIRDVAAHRASPPEYPGMALVPVADLDRLARYAELPKADEGSDPASPDHDTDIDGNHWPGCPGCKADLAAKVRALVEAGDALNHAGGSRHAGEAGPERDQRNRKNWFDASAAWWEAKAALIEGSDPASPEAFDRLVAGGEPRVQKDLAARYVDVLDAIELADTRIGAVEEKDGMVEIYSLRAADWHRIVAVARGHMSQEARRSLDRFRERTFRA
jgi:hypothetical protein